MDKDEYKKLLDKYLQEELAKTDRKPVGFFGTMAWHTIKKKEFDKIFFDKS